MPATARRSGVAAQATASLSLTGAEAGTICAAPAWPASLPAGRRVVRRAFGALELALAAQADEQALGQSSQRASEGGRRTQHVAQHCSLRSATLSGACLRSSREEAEQRRGGAASVRAITNASSESTLCPSSSLAATGRRPLAGSSPASWAAGTRGETRRASASKGQATQRHDESTDCRLKLMLQTELQTMQCGTAVTKPWTWLPPQVLALKKT